MSSGPDITFVRSRKREIGSFVMLYAVIDFSLRNQLLIVLLALGIVACIPMLLALMAGIAVRGRLDQVRFRQVIIVLLVASVANLLWRTFAT